MEWKHVSLPMTKKFKSVPSASKVMLMLFFTLMGKSLSPIRIMDRQSIVHSIVQHSKRS